MKRALIVLIVAAVLVIGLGCFRGWFAVTAPAADGSKDKVNVNLTMDSGKMKEDAAAVQNKTSELIGSGANKTPAP